MDGYLLGIEIVRVRENVGDSARRFQACKIEVCNRGELPALFIN